jgi:hypothetical protein
MRIFETVLADSRASLKGYLTAGCMVAATKLTHKHISQVKCLVSIITELQLDHPISLLSNGNLGNLRIELDQSKCIAERFILKLEQLFANFRINGGKCRAFDVNQTLILLEISRDAIHYLVRMAVGCFLRMVIFINNCKDGSTESAYLEHLENLADHSRLTSSDTTRVRSITGYSTIKDLEIPQRKTSSNSSNGLKTKSEDEDSVSNIPGNGTIMNYSEVFLKNQNVPVKVATLSRSRKSFPKLAETEA